jgi:hypothetical protein
LPAIEGSERDNTQDWIVPRSAVPTVGALEARIDEALVIARASEEGVREVGEMAIDAAKQARRAAEAAEQSAIAAASVKVVASKVSGPAGPVTAGDPPPPARQEGVPPTAPPPGRGGEKQAPRAEERASREVVIDPLQRFNERADALAARLERLQSV